MSDEERVRLARRAVARRIAGTMVVVTLPGLETRVLNELGARVIELADGRRVGAIVDALAGENDVPRGVLEHDVRAFVDELVRDGVLIAER